MYRHIVSFLFARQEKRVKMDIIYFFNIICHCLCLCSALANNEFDDSVLFQLTWPGSLPYLHQDNPAENVIVMTTIDNERYQCTLPADKSGDQDKDQVYEGASALELLEPLFSQFSCSYRLEQYWTYELCHGRYVKQYHDEKDVANPKKFYRQEYLLGRFDSEKYMTSAATSSGEIALENRAKHKIPTKKIETQNLPYFEIVMPDGTQCDLNEKTRSTRVMYICYPDSNNEIYSVEEVASCEYELIVLTPLLCTHPAYSLKETVEHDIQCHSLHGAPLRPLQLEKLEIENLKFTRKRKKAAYLKKFENQVPENVKEEESSSNKAQEIPNDEKLMKDFLNGDHCLYGGSSWWKFEFCNGKKVIQYHEYPDKRRIEIILGTWNEDKHLNWIEDNPHKRPKKTYGSPKQVSHLYSDGGVCDLTGKPRQVEVKIKCKESLNNPNAVSLYLLEPKSCEYILVVESSILCSLIDATDERGLFPEKIEL